MLLKPDLQPCYQNRQIYMHRPVNPCSVVKIEEKTETIFYMDTLNKCECLHDNNKMHWLRGIQTTYCHVFYIHVSLSLQLGYYLPVEPL